MIRGVIIHLPKEAPRAPELTVEQVIAATCAELDVTPDALLGPDRHAPKTLARHVAMYVSRCRTGASLKELGRAFGPRDHTTVLHAVRKIAHLVEVDGHCRDIVAAVERRLAHVEKLAG